MSLKGVIGNTISGNSCLAVNPTGQEVAYTAGATLVFYNPKAHKQTKFIVSENRR
eukprot:CAMPEP_0184319658 /NCGR_PEP_ID=MMETSP1049-20130417/109760_1 /TAXON_ID=77928 /ORGANISM="Proteomonas sulcata, Strain CCMP704" /LENGTH=54 /DNA_ID=CAMNT_0026639885 /DNA_START=163 /DNA_END=324 /DNA_ORIENTATION=-